MTKQQQTKEITGDVTSADGTVQGSVGNTAVLSPSALLTSGSVTTGDVAGTIEWVVLSRIVPHEQPRGFFEEEAIKELARSIRELRERGKGVGGSGLLSPILVRNNPQALGVEWIITAGERRYRALCLIAKEDYTSLDAARAPVVLQDESSLDAWESSITENLMRRDLTPLETSVAYTKLMKRRGYSVREAARRLGVSKSVIGRYVALQNMAPDLMRVLQNRPSDTTVQLLASLHAFSPKGDESPYRKLARKKLLAFIEGGASQVAFRAKIRGVYRIEEVYEKQSPKRIQMLEDFFTKKWSLEFLESEFKRTVPHFGRILAPSGEMVKVPSDGDTSGGVWTNLENTRLNEYGEVVSGYGEEEGVFTDGILKDVAFTDGVLNRSSVGTQWQEAKDEPALWSARTLSLDEVLDALDRATRACHWVEAGGSWIEENEELLRAALQNTIQKLGAALRSLPQNEVPDAV